MASSSFTANIPQNAILRGPIFSEPVQVILTIPVGPNVKIIAKGVNSGQVYEPILTPDQLSTLYITPLQAPFDADPLAFRLGIEALRIGLAYEYDPHFSLSIARIDPLPHQLEAVYDYFLKLPRVRFLLADDPGAGKTIMAGLLIKELKIRGLIRRILILTPANLTFQWQRELKEKFHEDFEVVNSQVLRANYGMNPWQERNQIITSVAWVSRIEDAKESLLRSHWDLIIVDEAHKMSAYSPERKTLMYRLGEALSERTDHYLLMTATPHKGDPENFCLFLQLLDKDIYGDVRSLEAAMQRNNAPFYLRRVKEVLVSFPDSETGKVKALFTKRFVRTMDFQIDSEEMEFYDDLTHYVEDQSVRAFADNSPTARAVGFTMAMLQRRFASSVYAVRRTLERMVEKRKKILADPAGYRSDQIANKLPEDFDELPEDEQNEILTGLESAVASINPGDLRREISDLSNLIIQAIALENRERESKLIKLKQSLNDQGVFNDPKMKLLIFTEHKDTLEYLVGKLRDWGLLVTQIHGSMKVGDRDTPNTRIYAEREFKESCQVLVATEAAGEGINLQFCWFMINYDIPWNPNRLEQRMGRIHRYGQERDCLIFNFVSTNTREGRVLEKLFERIRAIEVALDPQHTGKVFNVLGDIFPANMLERMIRDMYAHNNMTEELIKSRIIEQVDLEKFQKITASTLEGLAKRELNLSVLIGKSAEAKEHRLVPEIIEDFFLQCSPRIGLAPKELRGEQHVFRIGRIPRSLWSIGERLEPRFGRLGHEYKLITFNKDYLEKDPTLEWVTPGHPLFETVREAAWNEVQDDLQRGAIFYDLNREAPSQMVVYQAAVHDGRGNILHRRIFVIETDVSGEMMLRQPTVFLDVIPAPIGTPAPDGSGLTDHSQLEQFLFEKALEPFLQNITREREHENNIIREHLQLSLNELINRQQIRHSDLKNQQINGDNSPLILANLKQVEDRLEELNHRLERRTTELIQERYCTINDIKIVGQSWILPHPDRFLPIMQDMINDPEIEKIAIQAAIHYEQSQGWKVTSVELENRGFDLVSQKLQSLNSNSVEVKYIEVKGRAGIGEISVTANEYKTAERLQNDYWLYVVYNCSTRPEIHRVQNPARLNWQAVVQVEHYKTTPNEIIEEREK